MTDFVSRKALGKVYGKRRAWSRKGEYGKLLVVGGSERHTGSPVFAAMAAYRAGCDLVYVAAPQRAADVAAQYSPNIITEPLEGTRLQAKHGGAILYLIESVRVDAVLLGPGLWREKDTLEAICFLVSKINVPMVLDADAVRAVAHKKHVLSGKKVILTPHSNEFLELSGKKVSENIQERIQATEGAARELYNNTDLLKGHVDVVSDGAKTDLNKTGSPFMTKGGMGDTLAGIC